MAALGEAHLGEQRRRPRLRVRPAGQLERHRHVLDRGQGRDQVEGLEDVAHVVAPEARERVLVEAGDRDARHLDAARGRLVEPGDQPEQRRLAAARLPGRHLERHVGEHVDRTAAARETHG